MKTEYHKIDKNPKCIKCGKDAEYELKRRRFFYNYNCELCFNCLKEHFRKLKVFVYKEKD